MIEILLLLAVNSEKMGANLRRLHFYLSFRCSSHGRAKFPSKIVIAIDVFDFALKQLFCPLKS